MKKILCTALVFIFTFTAIQAQEKTEKNEKEVKLNLKVKDGAEPDVYVDGKKFEFSLNLIDPNKIASMNVVKGEEAIDVYNAPNGVILITTKETSATGSTTFKIKDLNGNDSHDVKTVVRLREGDDKNPLIIINGKKATQVELKKLEADDIESIEVIKDKKAQEEYKSDTGVIIVKTKKEVKEAKKDKEEK